MKLRIEKAIQKTNKTTQKLVLYKKIIKTDKSLTRMTKKNMIEDSNCSKLKMKEEPSLPMLQK
jgi:hypothetical protein